MYGEETSTRKRIISPETPTESQPDEGSSVMHNLPHIGHLILTELAKHKSGHRCTSIKKHHRSPKKSKLGSG